MDSKVAKTLANKLGITSPKIVRKASELNRLCEVRCTSGSLANLGMNETCRTVICIELAATSMHQPVDRCVCIELAATSMHQPVDRKEAIRLAGVAKKIYLSSYKTLESVLDLQPVLGIRDLAVQFGCIGAVDSAQDIISRYKSDYISRTGSDNDIDFTKPMFTLAALYTVCRHQKIKVDKTKMVAIAGVKRSTFDQTCTDFEKYATKLLGEKKAGKGKQKYWLDDLEKSFEEEEESPIKKKKTDANDDSGAADDYEEWKRKILEGAAGATKRKK